MSDVLFRDKRRATERFVRACGFAAFVVACATVALHDAAAADPATSGASVDYTKVTPLDLVRATPKGQLRNPYNDREADIVAEGSSIFLSYSCNGCHGGGGGGGICPPLSNDVWVYEGDDDTLFRLVTLGSDGLQKEGYTRKGQENVIGPMPPFGALIRNSDELWKILAFVRSRYSPDADPKYKFGTPPELR
ncbi:MAG: c-type cytochrome [Rhodanobacteraceae bacterium]